LERGPNTRRCLAVQWLATIFGETGDVTAFQECARAVLIFFYGLAMVRLLGRRIFGKWAALDIIVSIIVGSNLSRALTGNAPLLGTMLATTVLMAVHWVLAHAAARRSALSHAVEGRSIALAKDGALDPEIMKRHAVTEADLNEALRQASIETVDKTRRITLEPSGKITVVK
jgi:uncharacterized membrane protein YcaP (DUF421 family)